MKLSELIQHFDTVSVQGSADVEVTSVCSDSRKVTPGAVFIAVRGYASDGHAYIPQALDRGAVAVICEDIPEDAAARPHSTQAVAKGAG